MLPPSLSTHAPAVDRLFYVILWITGAAFVLVQATLLIFLVRYRRRAGRAAHYTHGNNTLEIIWTVIPAIILVGLTIASQRAWASIKSAPPANALAIEVTGEQFAWNVRYAGADGALGTPDDVTTINQLHVPAGRPVAIHLRSKDVIHSFFVPALRIKQDAVPGLPGRLWFEVTRPAQLEIVCAELCGLGHYRMRGFLTVDAPHDFDAWLATQVPEGTVTP